MRLNEPKLICIGGKPGSGKTTLGYKLHETILESSVVCPDKHLLILNDLDPEKDILRDEHITRNKVNQAIERMLLQTDQLLQSGNTVIVPSSFIGSQSRKAYEEIANKLDIYFCGLWVDAGLQNRKKRSQLRLQNQEEKKKLNAERGFNASAIASLVHLDVSIDGSMNWKMIDGNTAPENVFAQAMNILDTTIHKYKKKRLAKR